jgi:hypothetical protein
VGAVPGESLEDPVLDPRIGNREAMDRRRSRLRLARDAELAQERVEPLPVLIVEDDRAAFRSRPEGGQRRVRHDPPTS